MAVANYNSTYGCYPPPFTVDSRGRRLHSWRVLILPFIEQMPLYREIRLDEPWNSAHNKRLCQRIPSLYRLPGQESLTDFSTHYFAVVGKETLWRPAMRTTNADITDGPDQTVLVIENSQLSTSWMNPTDIEFAQFEFSIPSSRGICSTFENPAIAMADGGIYRIDNEIAPATLRALLTHDGGETIRGKGVDWHLLPNGRSAPSSVD